MKITEALAAYREALRTDWTAEDPAERDELNHDIRALCKLIREYKADLPIIATVADADGKDLPPVLIPQAPGEGRKGK